MEALQKIEEILKKIPRQYYLPIIVGCIGLMLLGYGIWVIQQSTGSRENSDFYDFSQPQNIPKSVAISPATIAIDVEGAVASPGVYNISENARVQDALIAAGGLSGNSDREWVAKNINLAAKITDGTKIYIPSVGEMNGAQNTVGAGVSNASGVLGSSSQQININTASVSDLDSLPGVGDVTANKIISGRPYSSIQDLLDKKIVSAKVFREIQSLILAQ